MRARHGAGAAAWVAGVLAAPGRGDDGEGSRGYSAPEGMSTSTGQYAPVSLPGEPAFLTEKPGRPQSAGPQRVGEGRSALCPQTQDYLCLRQLRPSEGWAWGWRGCLACGGKKCAGTRTASAPGVMPHQGLFSQTLVAGNQKASLAVFLHSSAYSGTYRAPLPGVLLCHSKHQAHRGAPLAGVLLCRWAHQALKGAAWWGPTLVQCVRLLMGQPLYCSAANAGVWGERGYGDGSTRCE